MNAIDYFKKYGLAESKKHLVWMAEVGARMDVHGGFMNDLKRLVEIHELVEGCGGIDVVKQHLKDGNVFRFEEKPLMKQAIADVESCQ